MFRNLTILAVGACVWAPPALATEWSSHSLTELAARAPIVVIATVRGVRYEMYDREHGIPVTRYSIRVDDALRGQIRSGVADLTLPGGIADDGTQYEIDDCPTLVIGQRYLLFLRPIDDAHVRAVDWSTAIQELAPDSTIWDGQGRELWTDGSLGWRADRVGDVDGRGDICIDGPVMNQDDETIPGEWWPLDEVSTLRLVRSALRDASNAIPAADIGGTP